LLFLAAFSAHGGVQSHAKVIYQQTLRSTMLVIVRQGSFTSTGTGFLVDRGERLMVTNQHVVGARDRVAVYFPAFKNGRVIAEVESYRKLQPIYGQVIVADAQRDLAVVQLNSVPPEAAALTLASESAGPTDRIHSIGNPGTSGALWVYTSGTVRQ